MARALLHLGSMDVPPINVAAEPAGDGTLHVVLTLDDLRRVKDNAKRGARDRGPEVVGHVIRRVLEGVLDRGRQ